MLYARDYAYADAPPVTLGTVAGVGITDVLSCRGSVGHLFAIEVVASSGGSVTVRVEGSVDGAKWFNLDTTGTDTTLGEVGIYSIRYIGEIPFVRGRVVSYEGGATSVKFMDSMSVIV